MERNELTVALIVGGASSEREVSKESGLGLYKALKELNYNVMVVDPAYGTNQPLHDDMFFDKKDHAEVSLRNYVSAINLDLFDRIDAALLGLHGKYGEDGTIQSLLEMRGVKYTGAGVLASALAMDKAMSKVNFKHNHVNTAKWIVVDKNKYDNEELTQNIDKHIKYPCIVKPNDDGSTMGLTLVREKEKVDEAVKFALKYSNKVLVEEYIPGREIAVGVLGQHVYPVIEIKPKHLIYDYECKYTDGMSEYFVPADIPDNAAAELKRQALLAYNSVGCEVYGRVDFMLNEDFIPYCLEVNTLPGMTSHSLLPKMANADGVSYEELVDRIIKLSLQRD